MNILFIGLNYAPEQVGIAVYSTGLAEALAARGHEVTVIAGQPYYPDWKPLAGSRKGWSRCEENGVTVLRCPHYIPRNPTGVRRLAHHATFALSALPRAIALGLRRPDVVFTVAPSLASAPVARIAARIAGAPLWMHVQDFEVEAAFATGLLKAEGAAAKLALAVERRIVRNMDMISTISPQMISRLVAKGVPADRTYELRNWADDTTAWPRPDATNSFARKWGLIGRKVALYSGNIANKQGLEIVIEAARRLQPREDIVFVICGRGPNRTRLEEQARGLKNIFFKDLQPREQLGELLSLASVHLLPQIEGAADLVLPSKLTNMLASGRPVIACAAQGTGLASEVEGCGLIIPPGDGAAMAEAIALLTDDADRCRQLGVAGKVRSAERWSLARIVDRFEHRLCLLAGQGQPRQSFDDGRTKVQE